MQGKITRIIPQNSSGSEVDEQVVNSGVYVFEPIIFTYIREGKKESLEEEIFPRLINENQLYGYNYQGYFMDMRRPETYNLFRQDVLKSLLVVVTIN